jgi:hypothetical protein
MYAERKKQLDEKFHKMHEEQSQKYGMFWVGMNEKLTNLVQREFPEVGFIITEDVQKGCKKCGASVKGHMVFPKEGGGPLCYACAEAAREAREK